MRRRPVGILHPGRMGASVAATLVNSGCTVLWVSEGRGPETRERAESRGLRDAGSLDELCRVSHTLFSVCPPHAAEDVARSVASRSFRGLYVDANAIAPDRAVRIGEVITAAGGAFVDGGIVGGPPSKRGETWLYLSGSRAGDAAALLSAGPLETDVLGESVGTASAIKMCYAAYTKGSTALLSAILAVSGELGVRAPLMRQWSRDWPELPAQAERRATRVTAKAWRFAGEMEEIAATFRSAGLPGGFHEAAADIYRRIAHFKDAKEAPALDEVLEALGRRDDRHPERSSGEEDETDA